MPNPLLQNENQELLYVEVYSQYSAGSGIDITSGVISLDPYVSASIDSKLASADFGTYSANVAQDIAYVSANACKTYSGISPIVVNDTTISADNFDLIIGSGLAFENNTLYVSAEQGNPEVENLVQTNSGLWNDVSAYQIASGDYATSVQLDTASSYLCGQIDNKLDKSDIGFDNNSTYVTGISGKEISASRANYANSATDSVLSIHSNESMTAQTARFDENGHSISATYSSLYDLSSFVNTNSGAWNDGKTYAGIAPIVVNNTTNEISADSQDITFGEGLDFTSGVLSVTAQGGGSVETNSQLTGDGTNENPLGLASSFYLVNPSLNSTANFNGSGVNVNGQSPIINLYRAASAHTTYGDGGMTITHSASGVGGGTQTSHYGEQFTVVYNDGDYYLHSMKSTKSGLSVVYNGNTARKAYYNYNGAAFTDDNGATNEYVNASSINKWNNVYDTVNTNSGSWGGGNPEVESYVQTNSASIDDAVSTYQSNSASYITQETDWTNTITAASSYAYSEAVAQIPTPFDPTYMSGAIDYVSGAFTGYLPNSQYETDSAVFNAKQDALTFGYDSNDAISSINSSAISDSRQGTDLYVQSPLFTGTSGTSAYIGWNNETVLWSGSCKYHNSATLSEKPINFDRLRFYWKDWNSNITTHVSECSPNYTTSSNYAFGDTWAGAGSANLVLFNLILNDDFDKTIYFKWGTFYNCTSNNITQATQTEIVKIVGIGRKQ